MPPTVSGCGRILRVAKVEFTVKQQTKFPGQYMVLTV